MLTGGGDGNGCTVVELGHGVTVTGGGGGSVVDDAVGCGAVPVELLDGVNENDLKLEQALGRTYNTVEEGWHPRQSPWPRRQH